LSLISCNTSLDNAWCKISCKYYTREPWAWALVGDIQQPSYRNQQPLERVVEEAHKVGEPLAYIQRPVEVP